MTSCARAMAGSASWRDRLSDGLSPRPHGWAGMHCSTSLPAC